MRDERPSSSAQAVAAARARLTRMGITADPHAEAMLDPFWRGTVRALGLPGLGLLSRTGTLTFLAARTRFFDRVVTDALDDGVAQVVVVAAGLDSRAWRQARPGVRFFEVDHPATQAVKRKRCPAGAGPTFVPVDVRADDLAAALAAAGFDDSAPAIFLVEGVTMYLTEAVVAALLTTLAGQAAPGSRLAVNFSRRDGGTVRPISRMMAWVIRNAWRYRGEPTEGWAAPDRIEPVVTRAGWRICERLDGPALVARELAGAGLPLRGANPNAVCLAADRAEVVSRTGRAGRR